MVQRCYFKNGELWLKTLTKLPYDELARVLHPDDAIADNGNGDCVEAETTPARLLDCDGHADDRQQSMVRFVRSHGHTCHAMDDGTIRIGIAATGPNREALTMLYTVQPIGKIVRAILGY